MEQTREKTTKEILTDWKILLPEVLVIFNIIFLSIIIFAIIDHISPLCSYHMGRSGNMIHTTCPSILWGYETFAMFSSLFLTYFGLFIVIPIILVSSIIPAIVGLPTLIREIRNSFTFMNTHIEKPIVKFLKISTLLLPIILIITILVVNIQILQKI